MKTKTKQSLILGALASSFGVLISKMLGLLYIVPLNSLAGEANMVFYGVTYSYYDLLLNISNAGIPFAIASLVAKYYAKEDYKTVLLVKKMGTSILLFSGFVISMLFLSVSSPLAGAIMGADATAKDVQTLITLFYILSLALIMVPVLSSIRGYFQGLKLLNYYAASQVLEQFARVGGIIFLGYFFVKILNFDSIWAIYMAILAATIGAVFALTYLLLNSKKIKDIKELATAQVETNKSNKDILRELFSIGLPFLFATTLTYIPLIVDSNFFIDVSTKAGYDYEYVKLVYGILQVNCQKIGTIPNVLSIGFCSGLVPYLTESLVKKDFNGLKNNIYDILNVVLFLIIPAIVWMFVYSEPIYNIMYGNSNLVLGSSILKTYLIYILILTVDQIMNSILITLGFRKNVILIAIVSGVVKLVSFFPLVTYFSYNGMNFSNILSGLVIILIGFYILKKNFDISYLFVLNKAFIVFVISVISCIPFLLTYVGYDFALDSRFMCIIKFMILGFLSLIIYLLLSDKAGLIRLYTKKSLKEHINFIINRFNKK